MLAQMNGWLLTFHCRSTGAYVSGRKAIAAMVQVPAKIIMIQKTQRQPRKLLVILTEKSATRETQDSLRTTHNPPAMGPRTGPIKTPAENSAVAVPRVTGSQMSTMTPPQFVKGAQANTPVRKRVTRSVVRLFARACPKWRST